jgi:endonuclease/exonuclease/phosphatase family metal-dependent hydrolase
MQDPIVNRLNRRPSTFSGPPMLSAIAATKDWIKGAAFLLPSNKPFKLQVRLLTPSLCDSYLVLEETPQSVCFIPITADIVVAFSIQELTLTLRFTKYENVLLSFRLERVRTLELFVSHLGKSSVLFNATPDKFHRENLAFLRRIKPLDMPKFDPLAPGDLAAVSLLSPVTTSLLARELWETCIRDMNSQFYVKEAPLRFSFLTWNVGNHDPTNDLVVDLAKCFRVPAAPVDMVLIALEEIDMSFKSIMTGSSAACERWTDILTIAKTLIGNAEYEIAARDSMGGVFCAAIVRKDIFPALKNYQIRTVKLGANGMLANKAAVVFQWAIGEATLAVICCHLAAHDQNWEHRNSQWHELVGDLDENIDYVAFMGDLNYRIEVTYERCLDLVRAKSLAELIPRDQLFITRQNDPLIAEFREAPITFNPTFKFDKNSDVYDTSAKHRVPSWTDRVLIKTGTPRLRVGLEDKIVVQTDVCRHFLPKSKLFQTDSASPIEVLEPNWPRQPHSICYRSLPNTFSDHRPVNAVFKFPIPHVDKDRLDELNEVIAAKFEELKALSVPSARVVRATIMFRSGQKTSFALQSTCLVWAHWKVIRYPPSVSISPSEGDLLAEEMVAVEVTFGTDFPPDPSIAVEITGAVGEPLVIRIAHTSDAQPETEAAPTQPVPELEPLRARVRQKDQPNFRVGAHRRAGMGINPFDIVEDETWPE